MQKKICVILFTLLIFQCSLFAQKASSGQIHDVPFASTNNMLELYIASDEEIANVTITMENAPSWIHVSPLQQTVQRKMKEKSVPAYFTFSIDESAPVKAPGQIRFTCVGISGKKIIKEINISVLEPTQTKLFQNYPNPFNPATVIRYQLSGNDYVTLKVYDVLGREVATLVDGIQYPGSKSVEWNAQDIVSGIYFIRLSAGEFIEMKRMILLR